MNNIFGKTIITPSHKRQAQFAGSWYDGDAKKLRPQLSTFLQNADKAMIESPFDRSFDSNEKVSGRVLAAISPHAGYMFSGATAGFTFEALRHEKIKRVFLLGPSHYVALHGCALPVEKSFATPLGDLRVDTRVVQTLKDAPLFRLAPDIHKNEHSLEMQLPFIREALGDVAIVPIIVGALSGETEMRAVGRTIRNCLKDGDVVLVSSDFTHFGPRYDFTPFATETSTKVKALDSEAFAMLRQIDLAGLINFRERTHATICGYYPCAVLLSILPADSHATLLKYETSRGMTGGDDDNFVSYMAIVFSSRKTDGNLWKSGTTDVPEVDSLGLSAEEKDALLELARTALTNIVDNNRTTTVADVEKHFPNLRKPAGAFVTLYTRNASAPRGKELRGCIGYILPIKSLAQAVADNTVGAASSDPRFQPVEHSELANLQIDINVLTAPLPVKSYTDIRIGVDGVIFQKNGRQSVFLPSVATEFGWSVEEMLSQLAAKAGFGKDDWKADAKYEVFQSDSFSEP